MTDLTGAWDCLTTTVVTTLSGRGGAVHACGKMSPMARDEMSCERYMGRVKWFSDQLGYGFDLHRRQRTPEH
jgi:hypothetical protein